MLSNREREEWEIAARAYLSKGTEYAAACNNWNLKVGAYSQEVHDLVARVIEASRLVEIERKEMFEMRTDLKALIINWLVDNENRWQRVSTCITAFRSYIYDADGNYLAGGRGVAKFIRDADKLLYSSGKLISL